MNERQTLNDRGKLHAHWTIDDIDPKTRQVLKRQEFDRNCFLDEGINELWTLVCGTGGTKFDNTNARTEVGDSATAADHTQTGLQGSNKYAQAMDATYPQYGSSQKARFRSTFATDVANWHWQEISILNGADDTAKNLNRLVADMGTKTSAAARVATLDLTLA